MMLLSRLLLLLVVALTSLSVDALGEACSLENPCVGNSEECEGELGVCVEPSGQPSRQPTRQPTMEPSGQPTGQPTIQPTGQPSGQPSRQPSAQPSRQPTRQPTGQPSRQPSGQPSRQPTMRPTRQPSSQPSRQPTSQPSRKPTRQPTVQPTRQPLGRPSSPPSGQPTRQPTRQPSGQPTRQPISKPSSQPSLQPSAQPSLQPSLQPSSQPTNPTGQPTSQPSIQPNCIPTGQPSRVPTRQPTSIPTLHTETELQGNMTLVFYDIKPNYAAFAKNEFARAAIQKAIIDLFPSYSSCVAVRSKCLSITFSKYQQYILRGSRRELAAVYGATVTLTLRFIVEYLSSDSKDAYEIVKSKLADSISTGNLAVTLNAEALHTGLTKVVFPFYPTFSESKVFAVKTVPPTSHPTAYPSFSPTYETVDTKPASFFIVVSAAALGSFLFVLIAYFSLAYCKRKQRWLCFYPRKMATRLWPVSDKMKGKVAPNEADVGTDDEWEEEDGNQQHDQENLRRQALGLDHASTPAAPQIRTLMLLRLHHQRRAQVRVHDLEQALKSIAPSAASFQSEAARNLGV